MEVARCAVNCHMPNKVGQTNIEAAAMEAGWDRPQGLDAEGTRARAISELRYRAAH